MDENSIISILYYADREYAFKNTEHLNSLMENVCKIENKLTDALAEYPKIEKLYNDFTYANANYEGALEKYMYQRGFKAAMKIILQSLLD